MAYTPEQLAVVCPKCLAARSGKCLEKALWGSKYMEEPHPERVEAARNNEC